MKKRLQGLIAGVLIGAMLTSGVVFAKQISETAELFYNNIKIYIDGGEIVPKDANGNVVEPFTMNGTTYLPVRAISNALGKDVEWDGATQSVYIGKKGQTKPDNYLDKIQYNNYKDGSVFSEFGVINGKVIDYNGNEYTNGLVFGIWKPNFGECHLEDIDAEINTKISYPLNSQYNNLKGKIVLPKEINSNTLEDSNCETNLTDILFYGDNKLLYKASAVTKSMPFFFDIDVSNVNQLLIKIKVQNSRGYVALTDLALYK